MIIKGVFNGPLTCSDCGESLEGKRIGIISSGFVVDGELILDSATNDIGLTHAVDSDCPYWIKNKQDLEKEGFEVPNEPEDNK